MNRFRSAVLVVLALSLMPFGAAAQAEGEAGASEPRQVVARLETTLIDNMKAGESMTFDDRYEVLRPLVADIMAVERMGRYLFGRDWQSFEPAQRERFTEAFLDLSAATYAGQFKAYGGERFDPVDVQRQNEDRAVVQRRLTTGSGKKIAFDYLMTRSDDGWQIVTIITDGVSDLALKRSQYRRILDESGFDAVIEHIRDSIESQRSD
ncbi:MAG: ABC transporter substrate-binding protein [Candidatus Wenzhouxiangella sp. M2_3B_020]